MSKEVNAAVGTERQFAKQPELPYALRLDPLNVSKGISQSVDYDAQRLASALGAMPKSIGFALEAIDKRKQENAKTLVNADEILAGKTKKDLQTFDAMIALQNVQGHNMSHNKYAMAILEQGMGRMASTYAKQELADMPEFQQPKSVEEAVGLFRQKLDENYQAFGDNIHNREAFNEGYYNEGIRDTLKVANEADQRINDVKKQQMVMLGSTDLQDALLSGISGDEFKNVADLSLKKIQLGTSSPKEFMKAITPLMGVIAEKDFTTERLNAIGDYLCQGKKVRDLSSLAPFYKKIAANFDKRVAEDLYNKCLMPDGSLNQDMFNNELAKLPKEFTTPGIPQIELSSTTPEILNNLDAQTKDILPSIGGILSMLGVGDAMSITGANGGNLNIYVGDADKNTKDQIVANLSQCFGSVSFKDDSTLQLGDYKGGLDNRADNAEISASAFSPDRIENIKKLAGFRKADRDRRVAGERQARRKQTTRNVLGATSLEEAQNAIMDSDLPPGQKQYLSEQVANQYNLTPKQLAKMSNEAKYFHDYTMPTGNLPSQFSRDLALIDSLEEMSDDDKAKLEDKDYNKFAKAIRRVQAYNAYYDKLDASNTYDLDTASEAEANITPNKYSYDDIRDYLKGQVSNWKPDEVEDRIRYAANKHGLSYEEANKLVDELTGGL